MSDVIKLFLLWLGIPTVGLLISYFLGHISHRTHKEFYSDRFSHFTDRELNILDDALSNFGNGNTYMSYEVSFEKARRMNNDNIQSKRNNQLS